MFEILILTLFPPALVCTIRRRVWFRYLWTLPGIGGCGDAAHVPTHSLLRSFPPFAAAAIPEFTEPRTANANTRTMHRHVWCTKQSHALEQTKHPYANLK